LELIAKEKMKAPPRYMPAIPSVRLQASEEKQQPTFVGRDCEREIEKVGGISEVCFHRLWQV
jgi:hypothetical protein